MHQMRASRYNVEMKIKKIEMGELQSKLRQEQWKYRENYKVTNLLTSDDAKASLNE